MIAKKLSIAFLGAVLIAGAALAHTPEKGKYGGKVVEAGDYHVEAVAKGTTLEVYVRDHDDKEISLAGFKGTAVLVVQGKPVQVMLAPRDGKVLTGTSSVELGSQIRGAIQITNPKNQTVQAKF